MTDLLKQTNAANFFGNTAAAPTFRFFAGGFDPDHGANTDKDGRMLALKSVPDEEDKGRQLVRMVASSNVPDLAEDWFTEKALNQMRAQAVGTTIFLNHQKNVPEDVFGIVIDAEIVKGSAKSWRGETVSYIALVYTVEVEDANPRAAITYKQIQNGRARLGASVTVAILNPTPAGAQGGRQIDDVYYLECSIVGLPMNPMCWVSVARRAVKDLKENAIIMSSENSAHSATVAAKTAADAQRFMELKDLQTPEQFSDVAIKGLFNDAWAKRKPSLYELWEVFSQILWQLRRLRQTNMDAGVADAFNYTEAVETAIAEFGIAVRGSALAMIGIEAVPAEVAKSLAVAESAYAESLLRGLEALETVQKSKEKIKPPTKETDGEAEDEGDEIMKHVQSVHDVAVKMGGKCHDKKKKEAGSAEFSPALVVTEKRLNSLGIDDVGNLETVEKAFEAVVARAEAIEAERAKWEASALLAKEALETFGQQPLTA